MGLTYPHEHFESRVLSLAGSSRVSQGDLKHKKDSVYLCVLKTEGPESSLQQCQLKGKKKMETSRPIPAKVCSLPILSPVNTLIPAM